MAFFKMMIVLWGGLHIFMACFKMMIGLRGVL